MNALLGTPGKAVWVHRVTGIVMLLPFIAGLSGCDGIMSILDVRGPMAEQIARLWWVLFWGSVVLGGGTIALVLYVVTRPHERAPRIGSGMGVMIGGGVVLPVVTLWALLIYGVSLGTRQVGGEEPPALTIEVVGHRFWWEVRYPDPVEPDEYVVSANEIHIPAGVPVDFFVSSADVIHSFWVPNLGGKIDMIPGRVNQIRLQANEPGVFRGQCAEYCGPQHARMAFFVRAHPPEAFEEWLAAERGEAEEPTSDLAVQGREQFFQQACMECHTIRGTPARGRAGPDLTRLGARKTLGAGTLEMSEENIAEWIAHNQQLKPGNRMLPYEHLDEETLQALSAYLESLQ
ncbi:cytochrome c oxidase subunit II [Alkalilimnicola ehrlichii]|nr:cytochrome c oxidase subunit II [Alkalilimnicola ehrlichii]